MKKTLLLICMLMLLSGCGGGGAEGKATDNSQVGSGGSGSGSTDGSSGGDGGGSGGSDGSGGGDGGGSGGSDGSGGGDGSGSGSTGGSSGGDGSSSGSTGGSSGGDGSGSGSTGGSSGGGSSGSGSTGGSTGGDGSGSGGSGGSSGGDGGGSGGGQVKPTLDKYEQLPLTFSADVNRNGHTVQIKVSKYSVRRADTEFYYYDASKSSSLIAFDYTPEVRSYRGQIIGEPTSQIVGYVDSKNQFYGFVFYGEDKAWTIENLVVPNLNNTAQKTINKALNRSPAELVPVDTNYSLPSPSLISPIEKQSQLKLQMSSIGYLVNFESYTKKFNKNELDVVGALDHTTNTLDYLFSRDALIRIDYPIGVIAKDINGKQDSEVKAKLTGLLRNPKPNNFKITHTFGENCKASGLSSSCGYEPKLSDNLHEIGHIFQIGHHVGPEIYTLMTLALNIDTNMIPVMKSSPPIESRLAPAMTSPMNPKANIDHIGTTRDQVILVDVLKNDFDANGSNKGGALRVKGVEGTSRRGGKVIVDQGMVHYTPPAGYVGEDLFGYTIIDDAGLEDSSEVHMSVKSKARVAYYSKNKYNLRQDIKNHDGVEQKNFKHLINQAGQDWFFSRFEIGNYDDIGFHQFLLNQTSTDPTTEPTFEENNHMTLQKHMPHDLVPGVQSYTVTARFKQDGHFQGGALNKGIHEFSIFSSGQLDEGFALSTFNGNTHRADEPEKGLGWTLVGRQMFSRQNFSQTPHIVHAFAKPDLVNIANNQWHDIAWVIDRERNNVSTWVNGTIVPMALSTDPTNFVDYVPLPDGFEGVYPGGTYGWVDSSWDASTQSYGPWFMRTLNSNNGKGAEEIWLASTNFIQNKFSVDDLQIHTYALASEEIKNIANGKETSFTNSPVNGSYRSFSSALSLSWENNNATEYQVYWGYSDALGNAEAIQQTKTISLSLSPMESAMYWRVDSKIAGEWITGNIWSVSNSDKVGEVLAVTFTNHELTGKEVGEDNDPWPINASNTVNNIHFSVEGQVYRNDASILRLSRGDTLTLTDNRGKSFSQIRFSASHWTSGVDGRLQVEYFNGSSWESLLALHKGGSASGYGYGGEKSSHPGIGSTRSRKTKPDWYDPAAFEFGSYYSVDLPKNTSQVRLKYYATDSDRNQVAIDQLNLYR